MSLSCQEKKEIEQILVEALRYKFEHYSPESKHMPFHTRLLGKDRIALFSFIHSLNTNFGTSINNLHISTQFYLLNNLITELTIKKTPAPITVINTIQPTHTIWV